MNNSLARRLPAALIATVLLAGLVACQSSSVDGLSAQPESATGLVGTTDGDLRVVRDLPPPAVEAQGRSAALSENDVIEVDVFQVDELDRTARIDESGFITMPLIGQVKAAGLTVSELEGQIERQYGANYLQNPDVTVFVKESVGQRVTMDGEFRKPGIFPVTAQSSLLQAVALAGGLSDIANDREVFIFREFPDGKLVAAYSLADIRAGKARDPRVYGGDVIVAFASGARIAARNLREALGIATSAGSLLPL